MFKKMSWEKLGLVYKPSGFPDWALNSALTPTPMVLHDRVRVYAGFRDKDGVSRIGYVDLDIKDPRVVLSVSKLPVLDIGESGAFDDNGVILGDVIRVDDRLHMYYVGFQLVNKVKFLAFTGLAISEDGGEHFVRQSSVPVLDRKNNAMFFNAVHSVIHDDSKFKFWLGAGSGWCTIKGTSYPSYDVKYIESPDGINFVEPSVTCLSFSSPGEYRIGRPRVYKSSDGFKMIFTWGDLVGNYRMGYAESRDGLEWKRNDEFLNFEPSTSGWDDKWTSYGALFEIAESKFMLYNGNDMGREGFGLARLCE